MHALPISKTLESGVRQEQLKAESNKLLNIMYHDGDYYI